jgi:hypothetical protein
LIHSTRGTPSLTAFSLPLQNTFITALDDQGVADASNIPGVTRIYHVPKSVKKTPRGNRRLEATDGTGTVTIDAQILSGPQVAQIVSQWQSLITAHAGSPAELRIPSPGKVVVEIAEGDAADKAEDWLVEQEEVVWVEQRSAIRYVVCVCVCVRERERESVCVCERI